MGARRSGDRFEVDFADLAAEGILGRARRLLGTDEVEVTPEFVGRAVREVMRACRQRHVDGRRIVWNEYVIFLSSEDRERLRPLDGVLTAGLLAAVRQERDRLGADMVGEPVLRIRCDRDAPLQPGTAVIRPRFEPDRRTGADADDEITVRAPEFTPDEATGRVPEPEAGPRLRLCWLEHSALLAPGRPVRLGRPHPGAPAGDFVALTGADSRINRVQLAISAEDGVLTISRASEGNPVVVDGHLVQPGGKLAITRLPVSIALSGDALTLTLERA